VDNEYGENLTSDFAVNDISKVWYRVSATFSTLFAQDANGDVISHMIYDPWGSPLIETYTDANYSGLDNLNNFTGYTWDEVLGVYYAQNRFYDADEHRFTQQDPVKDGGNWYVYVGNNPLIATDPWGMYYIIHRNDGVYYAKKQSEFDAVIQSQVARFSVDNIWGYVFNGERIVGGNSIQEFNLDEYAFGQAIADIQAWANTVIVPWATNIHPAAGTVAEIVINFGYDIYTFFKSVPKALAVANRDDILWKVFADMGIKSPHLRDSNSKGFEKRMATVDRFVEEFYKTFTEEVDDLGETLYNAGRAIIQNKIRITKKMEDKLYRLYYPEIVYSVAEIHYRYFAIYSCIRLNPYSQWNKGIVKTDAETIFQQFKENYYNICSTYYRYVLNYFSKTLLGIE
jgi:RHS repeat-associated protein